MANCLKRFGELKDNSDFLSLAKKLILSLNSKSIFFLRSFKKIKCDWPITAQTESVVLKTNQIREFILIKYPGIIIMQTLRRVSSWLKLQTDRWSFIDLCSLTAGTR